MNDRDDTVSLRPAGLGYAGALAALTLVGVAILLRAQQALTGNLWGVPVDDAYIHFRFAQNLASGHGFAFNPDQPVPGSTSPLWVVLLAIPGFFGAPLWLVAKVYGVLCLILCAVLTWRLAARFIAVPLVALGAGALTALDGRLLWAAPSGMEVTLFAALCLGAFLVRPPVVPTPDAEPAAPPPRAARSSRQSSIPASAARRSRSRATQSAATRLRPAPADMRPQSQASAQAQTAMPPISLSRLLLVAALCGLATLTRPEGYLFAVVLAVDLYLRHRPAPREVALAVTLYLALALPYPIFALVTTGHPLPTTFYAKASSLGAQSLPLALVYLVAMIYYVITSNLSLIVAPLGALALWRLRGEARAVVAWPLLLMLEQAFLSPVLYHFGRYVMPLEPFFCLWAVVGIRRLTRPAASAETWRVALPPLALVVVTALTVNSWANLYALSVRNINGLQVALGKWVRHNVPLGVPVATHDVGAIGYLSDHPVVDIVGLVTPRFIPLEHETPARRAARAIYTEVRREGARYLIIFPKVYSDLAAQPGLRRIHSATITHPVVVPANTMVVYQVSR